MSKKQDKWLQVNSDYSGIDTNGLVVRVGVYPVGAPELYGASDSLVEHGSAEWVDVPEAVVLEDSEPELTELEVESAEPEATDDEVIGSWEPAEFDLESLTNAQLRKLAEEKGIDHSGAKNKTELVALFEDAE